MSHANVARLCSEDLPSLVATMDTQHRATSTFLESSRLKLILRRADNWSHETTQDQKYPPNAPAKLRASLSPASRSVWMASE